MVNNVSYMGGSIGYLGGGTMNMDYSYVDHAIAPHYQLWKPPGAYYTRGEAPPPYEEAIAIAHAESLSSCTVSVATSTGRNFPIGVMQDADAVANITANTTNLISININGTGAGASVAEIGSTDSSIGAQSVATITNEDPPYLSGLSNNRVNGNGQIRLSSGGDRHDDDTNEDLSMTIYNFHSSNRLQQSETEGNDDGMIDGNVKVVSNHHCTGNKTISFSSGESDLCMNASCALNIKSHHCNFSHRKTAMPIVNTNCGEDSRTGVNVTAIKNENCSSMSMFHKSNRLPDGVDKLFDTTYQRNCQSTVVADNCGDENPHLTSATESPVSQSFMHSVPVPAMFNDDMINDTKFRGSIESDVIKNRLIGKKYHRTIPRHFSVVDPIINPIKANSNVTASANISTAEKKSSASSDSYTSVQQVHRMPEDTKDKQLSQRMSTQVGSITNGHNVLLATGTTNNVPVNRKVCQCPVQHKALPGYQSIAPGMSLGSSLGSADGTYRSIHFRGDACNKQVSMTSDPLIVSNNNTCIKRNNNNAGGVMKESFVGDKTPLKKEHETSLTTQRYHEKQYRKTAIPSGENMAKSKQQNNNHHSYLSQSDKSSHIVSSEYNGPAQLPSNEIKSTRSTTSTGFDSDDYPHSGLKQIPLNTKMNNDTSTNLHSHPILPPKAKKQQHQQHHSNNAFNNKKLANANLGNSSSILQLKTIATSENINTGKVSREYKLRELQKSLIHVTHDVETELKNCSNGNSLLSGFSNTLPRHSFTAIRNYERKQRNDNILSHSFGRGSKSNRIVGIGKGLLHEKAAFDCNTLPKNTSNNNGRKTSLVTEAVNHIPSVINIPVISQTTTSYSNINSNNSSVNNCGSVNFSTAVAESSNNSVLQITSQSSIETTVISTNADGAINGDGGTNSNSMKPPIFLPLPVLMTTITNCANPREHVLPNDNSVDEDYLSECENCKSSANNMRYYLDLEDGSKTCVPMQETMTLQRKMPDSADEEQQNYYRVSSTLPTNTSKRNVPVVNKDRVAWFSTIPANSSSDDEEACE
uniref:putative uncharacterized protein DDB_G0282133 n=1 Tax=Anopheles coluzzii TaxID=1518534 RepID=UPI0020FFB237|nr:putative uncharacterized protein DDB_G0282133 [Anopheles coluzzii]